MTFNTKNEKDVIQCLQQERLAIFGKPLSKQMRKDKGRVIKITK